MIARRQHRRKAYLAAAFGVLLGWLIASVITQKPFDPQVFAAPLTGCITFVVLALWEGHKKDWHAAARQ